MTDSLPRHHLVWLGRPGGRDALAVLDGEIRPVLADWFARDLPAVVRRYTADEPKQAIALGIPLSPARGRRRIAFNVPVAAIQRINPPPTLGQVVTSAPALWREPLRELDTRLAAVGLGPRVYGSLAWQHITQENYLTECSDVDLLLQPQDRGQLQRMLVLLQDWERQTGLRADGECLLPDGAAVAWRELLGGSDKVLVKSTLSLMLRPIADVFGALPVKTVV